MRHAGVIGRLQEEIELLQRHILMLQVIRDNQPIGIIRLSEMVGVPQHKIRYSLRILEKESLIRPTPSGARSTTRVDGFLDSLRTVLADLNGTVTKMKKGLS